MDYIKLIEAYFNGKLTGSELSDFLKEVKRNPELAEEVEKYKKNDEMKKQQGLERIPLGIIKKASNMIRMI
jgi:hypothetical protein